MSVGTIALIYFFIKCTVESKMRKKLNTRKFILNKNFKNLPKSIFLGPFDFLCAPLYIAHLSKMYTFICTMSVQCRKVLLWLLNLTYILFLGVTKMHRENCFNSSRQWSSRRLVWNVKSYCLHVWKSKLSHISASSDKVHQPAMFVLNLF